MSDRLISFEAVQSPGLRADRDLGPAFELKFRLTAAEAPVFEAWAWDQLRPDPHGQDGTYRVTSVYCDTPRLEVFHRSPGYRRAKFRLRRYGDDPKIFLERKTRRGDRVRKRRVEVRPEELGLLQSEPNPAWAGDWFARRIRFRSLRPTCQVGYWRTAFFGQAGGSPVRLTLDRELVGLPAEHWLVPRLDEGVPLLPGGVLLELKFHVHLPPLFHELLPRLPIQEARVSKYRRCVELCRVGGWDVAQPPSVAERLLG